MRSPPPVTFALLLSAAAAGGVERFVDVNGVDSGNDCTGVARPCRTITRALSLGGPAEVVVGPGTYSAGETFPLGIPDGVFLRSVAGAAATTILREDAPTGPTTTVELLIDGPASRKGIQGFTVNGNNLGHAYGVYLYSIADAGSEPSDPPYVRGCRVQGYGGAGSGAGILVVAWGCCQGGSHHLAGVIEGNVVLGGGSGAMDGIVIEALAGDDLTGAAEESLIASNLVSGCRIGIDLASVAAGVTPAGRSRVRTRLFHNTVLGSQLDGIRLHAQDLDPAPGEPGVLVAIANNIVTLGGGAGIAETSGIGSADASLLRSNLIFANLGGGYADLDSGRAYSSEGELNSIPDLGTRTASNLARDPLLGGDGHLASGSPAVAAADPAYPSAIDFDGETRPLGAGAEIGADEVAVVLRGTFTALSPLTPGKATVFASLSGHGIFSERAFVDPDPAIASWALVVYQAEPTSPPLVRAVKEPSARSVRLEY